jgi:hypothetical protein
MPTQIESTAWALFADSSDDLKTFLAGKRSLDGPLVQMERPPPRLKNLDCDQPIIRALERDIQ